MKGMGENGREGQVVNVHPDQAIRRITRSCGSIIRKNGRVWCALMLTMCMTDGLKVAHVWSMQMDGRRSILMKWMNGLC